MAARLTEASRAWEAYLDAHGVARAAPRGFPYPHRTVAEVDASEGRQSLAQQRRVA